MYQLLLVIVQTQWSEKHLDSSVADAQRKRNRDPLDIKKKSERSLCKQNQFITAVMCINGVGATAPPRPPDRLFRFYCVFIRTQSHIVHVQSTRH